MGTDFLSSPYCFLSKADFKILIIVFFIKIEIELISKRGLANKNNLGPRSQCEGKCFCDKYRTFTNVPTAAGRDALLVMGKDVKSGVSE